MSASGGGHGSLDSKPLKLTVVSPLVGKSFMEAAQRVCLESYPSVVPLFNKGIMPRRMKIRRILATTKIIIINLSNLSPNCLKLC